MHNRLASVVRFVVVMVAAAAKVRIEGWGEE